MNVTRSHDRDATRSHLGWSLTAIVDPDCRYEFRKAANGALRRLAWVCRELRTWREPFWPAGLRARLEVVMSGDTLDPVARMRELANLMHEEAGNTKDPEIKAKLGAIEAKALQALLAYEKSKNEEPLSDDETTEACIVHLEDRGYVIRRKNDQDVS